MSLLVSAITPEEIDGLRFRVKEARKNAYAPYSKFRVGAVLLTNEGQYISGCNVENASYPAGICAERTALVKAISSGINPMAKHPGGENEEVGNNQSFQFKAIAVITDLEDYCSPCGICRQMLREFAPEIEVYMFKASGKEYKKMTLGELLPMSFGPEDLEKNKK